MSTHVTTETKPPSIFTLSVVFGGAFGMLASTLLGYRGDAGFVIGLGTMFLLLSAATLIARFALGPDQLQAKLDLSRKNALEDLEQLEREQKIIEQFIEERARAKNLQMSPAQKQKAVTTLMSAINAIV